MPERLQAWARAIAKLTARRPAPVLLALTLITLLAGALAEHLQLRMSWTDLLPADDENVLAYREIQSRFPDPSIIVTLSGSRDSTVAMAEELQPRLEKLSLLYNVQGRLPADFFFDQGWLLQKPRDLDRAMRIYAEPDLLGALGGLNDDLEGEYQDQEENIRRDEAEISRSMLGLHRSLEILDAAMAGDGRADAGEAADATLLGEPWNLSLDRRMLLISCYPRAKITEVDQVMETVNAVQSIVDEVAAKHPGVKAGMAGMATISRDEMNSVGLYTQLLGLAALLLIYLLLVRAFRGWIIPLLALLPILAGIIWNAALLQLLFGSLNIFSMMMMLVLLGLGIDFSIHFVSRYFEERRRGHETEEAIAHMLSGTGKGVFTGALTTAAAFFALVFSDTRGVMEFGVAAGSGVLLTLIAVFLAEPALLVLRERRFARGDREHGAVTATRADWPTLGRLARWSWRHYIVVLLIFIALGLWARWSSGRTAFEYNFLNLEAKGLSSVRLTYEIPDRFGLSDQAAWLLSPDPEAARRSKESLRKLSTVGEVLAVSDVVPPPGRRDERLPKLEAFRRKLEEKRRREASAGELSDEIDRLWDNLDLMSNLAFQAGLDRIVQVLDDLTGYDSSTDRSDSTAVLPSLIRRLGEQGADEKLASFDSLFSRALRSRLESLTTPEIPSVDKLPESLRRAFLPIDGGPGFLTYVTPRRILWNRPDLDRFLEQTSGVAPHLVSTQQLIIVMLESTLRDGGRGAKLAMLIIAVLLLIHFRSARGLLAAVPLLGGALLMLGLMHLLGMKYNYLNLIAVPIILGIGIDDGVHALQRFDEEQGDAGERIGKAFSHVGRPILLTSLTTMIGFGSVAFYSMRGMSSFGRVLFMGVGACFLTTVLILPAVLRLFSGRRK